MVWIDCETTGLDKDLNGIIEVAFILPNKQSATFKMCPAEGCVYDDEALEINGYTMDKINYLKPEKKVVKDIVKFLDKNLTHKGYHIAGYNSDFDMGFLSQLFKRNGVNWWNYFDYYNVDVYAVAKILNAQGKLKDTKDGKLKLQAVCDAYGVELLDAHDAVADITATKKLYKKLLRCLRK